MPAHADRGKSTRGEYVNNAHEVEEDDGSSHYTANLYSDVSDERFSDCHEEFEQEANALERDYFESLEKATMLNESFAESPTVVGYGKTMSSLEETHFHTYNVTPDRPCSAYFKCDSFMSADEVFDSLKTEGFRTEHVRCLQRKPSGEIFITFRNNDLRNQFLKRSSFVCNKRPYAVNDAERPLTFLTIYDAPYELSDAAIVHRLSPYCDIMWYRRGSFKNHAGVFNGLRHFRVRVHHKIPSYLRFGKFQIRLYHDGQIPTCRRCNRTGHKARDCKNTLCFNCDGLGHTSRDCIRPMYCCICKSGSHLAYICPLSWSRSKPEDDVQEQPERSDSSDDEASNPDEDENIPLHPRFRAKQRGAPRVQSEQPSGGGNSTSSPMEVSTNGDNPGDPPASPTGPPENAESSPEMSLDPSTNPADPPDSAESPPGGSLDPPTGPADPPESVIDSPRGYVDPTASHAEEDFIMENTPDMSNGRVITLDADGQIVELPVSKVLAPRPPTVFPSSSESSDPISGTKSITDNGRSWADIVDSSTLPLGPVSPSTSTGKSTSDRKKKSSSDAPRKSPESSKSLPQRNTVHRRRPAIAPKPILSLGRRPTQPSKIPTSNRDQTASATSQEEITPELMDSSETRKRKNPEDFDDNDSDLTRKAPTT